MRRDPEQFYWRNNPEWYRVTSDGDYEMTEKAPAEAIKSFEDWKNAWNIK